MTQALARFARPSRLSVKDTHPMHMDRKALPLTLKAAPGEDGVFEGYASVFDVVDLGNDTVARGAFTKSLSTRTPKMLWQHEIDSPIGVWDLVAEDTKGLYVRGRCLPDVTKGRDALALLKAGAIDSMSIGYRTIESTTDQAGVRKLLEVELYEISLVTFPMLPDAKVTDVKSIQTERDFERFLRDAGYSKSEAVALTSHGFKGLKTRRDAGDDAPPSDPMSDILTRLSNLRKTLNV